MGYELIDGYDFHRKLHEDPRTAGRPRRRKRAEYMTFTGGETDTSIMLSEGLRAIENDGGVNLRLHTHITSSEYADRLHVLVEYDVEEDEEDEEE